MYNAVICCINSKYIHSSLAPWCLLSGVKEYCKSEISARVVEGTINEKPQAVVDRIFNASPDAVSFCCYIWNIRFVNKIAKAIKEHLPDVKIIFGGPEVSFNQSQILTENEFVDFVLCGEGEQALAGLLDCLCTNTPAPKGLAGFKSGQDVFVGNYHTAEKELSPYGEEYLSSLSGRIAYIEASRGCPYNCAFCLSGTDRTVRFFDMERVKKEILLLSQAEVKTVKFVDRTFNCNKKRATEILLFIKENYGKAIPDSVCFHFEIAADILDEQLLRVISLMPVGSVQFEAGIQSFNSRTLESINRKTNLEKLCQNIKTLVSFRNCHIHIDLIAGLPYEDFASFAESFNKAYALKADMLQLGFLKILHGSCMETKREEYPCEYGKEPPYEVIATPWISESELQFLHRVEDVFERLYNSGRFHRTVDYVISKSGKKAFDVFSDFAKAVSEKQEKMPPLDLFTKWVFEFFSNYGGIEKAVLRDKMMTDRIATNSSGIIPKCLKIEDDNLKKAKHRLALKYPPNKGVMRSVAILYSEKKLLWCDYEAKNKVSGEYEIRREDFDL
ncbi:MAG: DUF4080 domain-containing protein [Acutalibacteraceae bacterium]